jgi:hypothetical protein
MLVTRIGGDAWNVTISRSSPGLRPLSERLLKPPPQFICLTLRKLPEALFKLALQLIPRAFDLKLVHRNLDT